VTHDTLQSRLNVYLELRRSLGYKTSVQEHALRDFLDYLAIHGQQDPIRAGTAVDWARQASERCYRTGPAVRLRMVRGFLVHLRRSNRRPRFHHPDWLPNLAGPEPISTRQNKSFA